MQMSGVFPQIIIASVVTHSISRSELVRTIQKALVSHILEDEGEISSLRQS
jgi:hypothetical protein